MSELYNSGNNKVYLSKNILYFDLDAKDLDEDILKDIMKRVQKFYDICIEKKIYFFMIFNIKQCTLDTVYKLKNMFTHVMKDFFLKNAEVFMKNLYCTSIILDSAVLKTALSLFLKVYTPYKPVKFVKTREQALEFFIKIKEDYKNNKYTMDKITPNTDHIPCTNDETYTLNKEELEITKQINYDLANTRNSI